MFSLGVTLYELLTGRPAFAGESIPELLRQVEEMTPPSPRARDEVRQVGYSLRMTLAAWAYRTKDFERGRELLADDGTADLRGWEWRLLRRELHPEQRRVSLPTLNELRHFGPEGLVYHTGGLKKGPYQ